MKILELKIKDIKEKTADIKAGLNKSASPEALSRAREATQYRKSYKGQETFYHSGLPKEGDECSRICSILFLFGIVLVSTIIAALLIIISTVVSLIVFKHSKTKYFSAAVCILAILAIWVVYDRFFNEPMYDLKKNRENWEALEYERNHVVENYEDAVRKFESRDVIVPSENRGEILDNLCKGIRGDFEEQDRHKLDSRPNPDNSGCQVQPLRSNQNFKSIH